MNFHRLLVTLIFSILLTTTALAVNISGVNIPDKLNINQQNLSLNGAGVRDKFFIDLYVGSLYVPQKSSIPADILNQSLIVIRLNITSNLITNEKMQHGIHEGFETATEGKTAPILSQINQFMNLFNQTIHEGDQFSFVASKNYVECYKNNQLLSTIRGNKFRQALLGIWLGEHPTQHSLKQSMLGA